MSKRWYVVHAYSGFEKHVMRSLIERVKMHGMEDRFGEILVPTEEVVEMRDGKRRKSERKFYPGYVLVEMEMVDETSDVAPYYLAADIYVHPTLNDSFGMAPLEAMSYELPVILSPAPWCGFAQYVEPNTEALLLSHPEAHDELAAAIERIATDTELLESLREGGSRVVERHSWAEVARRYEELYRACLAERSARDT